MIEENKSNTFSLIKLKRSSGEEREFLIGQPITPEEIKETATVLTQIILDSEPISIFKKHTFEKEFTKIYDSIQNHSILIKACYLAKDPVTNKIIGVSYGRDMTYMFTKEKLDAYEFPLLVLLWKQYVDRFEEKYTKDTKIFRVQYVAVDREYYGFGLGKILVENVLNSAKEGGFRLVAYEASNLFSLKVARDVGFEIQSSIIYDEYIEETEQGNVYPYKGINDWFKQFITENTGKIVETPAPEIVLLTQEI